MIKIIVYIVFSFMIIYMVHNIYSHFQIQLHSPLHVNHRQHSTKESVNEKQENKQEENEKQDLELYLNSLSSNKI